MVDDGPQVEDRTGVHVHRGDTGRHVLIVHGALDRAAGMTLIARRLRPQADVTWYDRRGYATRWDEPGQRTIAAHIDDALSLLDGRPSWIVGHSLGGDIALGVADRRPDLVLGLTVYETPLSWMDFWPDNSAGADSVAAGPERAAEAFMLRMIGARRWNDLPERTKDARRREGAALVAEMTSLRSRPPWAADRIRCRVIVGRGEKATAHHLTGSDWLASNLPDAELRVLRGAGHGAPTTHADEFVDELVLPHFTS